MKKTNRPEMTYALAMAIGKDTASRRMHAAGRLTWTQADYDLAARTFTRLSRSLATAAITPSVPPSLKRLIAQREADVRSGQLVARMSR